MHAWQYCIQRPEGSADGEVDIAASAIDKVFGSVHLADCKRLLLSPTVSRPTVDARAASEAIVCALLRCGSALPTSAAIGRGPAQLRCLQGPHAVLTGLSLCAPRQ